jgi:urease accessory protein
MFDGTSPFREAPPGFPHQRTDGAARVSFVARDGRSWLADLYQRGAMKVRMPRVAGGEMPEAVLLNTSGGLTGGDKLAADVEVGSGAGITVTTQACEKVYRAIAGIDAKVANRIIVGAGGRCDWLPQETILFDRGRLVRRLEVDLAEDARFLASEAVVLGRTAMGETVGAGLFQDSWRVRRGGRLVFADATRLAGDIAAGGAGAATLGGRRAFATLLLVASEAETTDMLASARFVLDTLGPGAEGGASAFDGLLVARLVAGDGAALRRALTRLIGVLRRDASLPRVWWT